MGAWAPIFINNIMKICWDNLEKLKFTTNGNFKVNGRGATYYEKVCLECGEYFLGQSSNIYCDDVCTKTSEVYLHKKSIALLGKPGHPLDDAAKIKISEKNSRANHGMWKGGYCINNIPLYNTYTPQLEPYKQCRRNQDDPNILEVKCTYCGQWYIPSLYAIRHRIRGINKNGGHGLYCSEECKQECPIYHKIKHYKGQEGHNSREVQPQLRQMTFTRDDYICVKCGSTGPLHCHHIDPVISNPIESADLDNCITLCVDCHKEAHRLPGCGYSELRCT